MRIEQGTTTRYIYFVAVDATDLKTRETGLSGFTVYRSRNGGAAVAMTTPTINETDSSNMPGVYELLLDEDTTIGAANDTEEMVLHITHASMAPVTRVVELYRPETTAGTTLTVGGGLGSVNVVSWSGFTVLPSNVNGVPLVDTGYLAGVQQSLTDLKDFADAGYDPATNKVQGVVLVDTTTVVTGHTAQTGDNYARLGAPAGASVSADVAAVKADTAATLLDTGTDGVLLAPAAQQDVAQIVHGQTTWFVSGDGDNSDGLTWDTAYNEIQTAVAAAGNGDLIKVGEGTYSTVVDIATAAVTDLTIEGVGIGSFLKTTGAGDLALTVHHGTTLRKLKIESLETVYTDGNIGVASGVIDDLTIEDCWIKGNIDAISLATGCNRVTIRRTYMESHADGISIRGSNDWLIEDCTAVIDGTRRSASSCLYLVTPGRGKAKRSTFVLHGTASNAAGGNALGIQGTATETQTFEDCDFIAVQEHVDNTTNVIAAGEHVTTNGMVVGTVHFRNCSFYSRHDGSSPGTVADIQQQTGTVAVDGDCYYDRTKTSGTITNLGDGAEELLNTTIATLASQTSFTLSEGSADDDTYNDMAVVVQDQTTSIQKAVGVISDYTGSTKTITLRADPGIFTMAVGDKVTILLDRTLAEIGAAGATLTNLGGMSTGMKAEVNTEVVDVMRTDTNAELAQGIPPATPTFEEAVMLLYQALRNKLTVTATEKGIYNDAGTKIAKKTLSDDGTTYTEAEAVSGA